MFKIKRAIIMAAGFGSRMVPITLSTPKPLIEVNGKRIIESIIEGLHENDIYEIYIVIGYLKEQFNYLKDKYQNITLIENPHYNECNNISSLYVARKYINDTIILDGDQIIYNSDVLSKKFDKSGYNVVWTDKITKEWLLTVENGNIVYCDRNGGEKGWKLYSISRWTKEDGERLAKHIEIEFEEKKNYQIYWDDVALFCYPDEYNLGIFTMDEGDVIEIDSYEELVLLDSKYKGEEN